jgi:hypothetical protein
MTARPMPRSLPLLLLCPASLSPEAPASPWPAGSGAGIAIPDGELIEACTQVDFARDELYTPAGDQRRLARVESCPARRGGPEGLAFVPDSALLAAYDTGAPAGNLEGLELVPPTACAEFGSNPGARTLFLALNGGSPSLLAFDAFPCDAVAIPALTLHGAVVLARRVTGAAVTARSGPFSC